MTSNHLLPFVSILVINYQGERHLDDCLQSLRMQTYPRHLYEVIVLDNNSSDQSLNIVRQKHSWCCRVALKNNVGFAQGNNIAAKKAHGSWCLLLNNDTIADPHLLNELFSTHDETVAARVAKLVFTHEPRLLNSTGSYVLRDGRGADRGFRQFDRGNYEVVEPIFAGCGAALAVRATGLREAIFDPSYFVYYEDTSHCWLLRHKRQGIHYHPRALVRHTHGAAAGERSLLFHYYVERNRALTSLRCGDLMISSFTFVVIVVKSIRAILLIRNNWQLTRTLVSSLSSYSILAPKQILRRFASLNQDSGIS